MGSDVLNYFIYPNIVLLIHHLKDGRVALVHTNLNMFCIGILLKVEDWEGVLSYMQIHRHAPTRGAASPPIQLKFENNIQT